MKHLGQNGQLCQKGQIVHFVFEKESKKESNDHDAIFFGVCKYVQRNGTITTY